MAAKKRTATQEPLLNTVARTLGHAAGTLTKVTHEFTENLSTLPENLATKVRETANIGAPKSRPRRPKKKTGGAAKVQAKRVAANKRKPAGNARRSRKKTKVKGKR
jgi:hypothetical protein